MAKVRYVVIEVWEGEEDRLRSAYSYQLHTGGIRMNADGVKHAYIPVESADVSGCKVFDDAMKKLKELSPVKLESI